jgi:hypothetical protein
MLLCAAAKTFSRTLVNQQASTGGNRRLIIHGLSGRGVAPMIDTLLWYTGLAAWILIAIGGLLLFVADAHDRSVRRRNT